MSGRSSGSIQILNQLYGGQGVDFTTHPVPPPEPETQRSPETVEMSKLKNRVTALEAANVNLVGVVETLEKQIQKVSEALSKALSGAKRGAGYWDES